MQLKNIPSPGTSKQGQGVNESGIKQTWVDCVKKRSGESDALLRLALKMCTFPSPSSLPPTIPPLLPNVQPSESYPQPWKGVDLGRTERLQMEGVSQSVTDSDELWSEQCQD